MVVTVDVKMNIVTVMKNVVVMLIVIVMSHVIVDAKKVMNVLVAEIADV